MDLKTSVKRAIYRLAAIYLVAFLFTTTLVVYIFNVHHTKLAESFVEAAHNSLMIRDLRQTVSVLTPALHGSFQAITFETNDGTTLFSLPSKLQIERAQSSVFSSQISIPILSSSLPNSSPIGVFHFSFNWALPALYSVIAWAVLLALSFPVFRTVKDGIVRRHMEILKAKESELLVDITSQISHDIRSPLSAINMVVKTLNDIPAEKRLLIEGATARINGMANDLLDRYKASGLSGASQLPTSLNTTTTSDLSLKPVIMTDLLHRIGSEKQAILGPRGDVRFKIDAATPNEAACSVDEKELARAISNLIDNAAEALSGVPDGVVTLSLRAYGQKEVAVIVSDNGKGIPDEILADLGKTRISHGKEGTLSGSGLGVLHAVRAVEGMGGKFSIQSKVGMGTMITMRFSRIDTAQI